jgi:hypothetical protein
MQQFTFICAVAEVNVCYSQARGRDEAPVPQLNFRQKLTQQLLLNTLDAPVVVPVARMANRRRINTIHALRKRGKNEGKGRMREIGSRLSTISERFGRFIWFYNANAAKPRCRTFCACSPATSLCAGCFVLHYNEVE